MSTTQCSHCGKQLEVPGHVISVAEEYADGTITCSACEGMHELPDNVPECDVSDCTEPAPFSLTTVAGEIRRCRNCLIQELDKGWHMYYEDSPR